MEPVSFAVGIIGLAGLFNTCLDAADRIDSWREYDTDHRALQAQYNAQKLRLEKWGLAVGLQDEMLLSDDHDSRLDDPSTSSTVKDLLMAIEGVCRGEEKTHLPSAAIGKEKPSLKNQLLSGSRHGARDSRREKLRWALGAKARRLAQVEQFTSLVENLYGLIPLEDNNQGEGKYTGKISNRDEILENKAWKNELREILQSIEAEMQEEIKRDIHAWLVGSTSSSELYETFVEKRIDSTCDWVLDKSWYLDWASSEFSNDRAKILWINGPAGFGKSIMSARITESLSSTLEDPLGYFFISSDFESRKDPFVAIRSWISQLLKTPAVFALVREIWSGRPELKATRGDTLKILRNIVTTVPRCTFVLDGLDECSWSGESQSFNEDNPITEFLHTLRKAIAGTSTRILIVSRDEPEIRSCLSEDPDTSDISISQYKIRPEDVQSDVEAFSRSVVNKKLSSRSEIMKEDIAQKLAKQCNGQFLWVKMQEDHLRSGKSQKKLEQAINSTPPGLEHTYDRNWMRISKLPEDDRERTLSLLRWASFALRPLSVSEITGALSISTECDEVELDEIPDSIDEEYLNTEILELCGSLVEIRATQSDCEPGLRTVHLTHFTVKEYLLCNLGGQGGVLKANASLKSPIEIKENTLLARMCLCYVDCEDVWELDAEDERDQILTSFREYAASSWHRHAHIGDLNDDPLVEQINQFFDVENSNWISWTEWYGRNDEDESDDSDEDESDSSSEDGSESSGSSEESDSESESSEDSEDFEDSDDSEDSEDSRSQSSCSGCSNCQSDYNNPADEITSTDPLYYASYLGLVKTTEYLLENDCPINEKGNDGDTPLVAACRQGNIEIIKKLIASGADLTITNNSERNPLEMTAERGHLEAAKLLLQKGADIAAGNPLLRAADAGHLEMVSLLIASGADCNLQGGSRSLSPLSAASEEGHLEVVRLLLDKGANIEIQDEGQPPICLAAISGHLETIRLLLERGADLNSRNGLGWTPLLAAADEGYTEIVRLLLEKGADVEIAKSPGDTAIYFAAQKGHTEIVRLLVDKAELNNQNRYGLTPLIRAAEDGTSEIVELLVQKGADLELVTRDGHSALYTAASSGNLEAVRLLLDRGADLNHRTNDGWNAVNGASMEGSLEIVKLLVEKGADIEAVTDEGYSSLHSAVLHGSPEIVRFLLDHGANLSRQDKDGWSPLNNAAWVKQLDIVQLLLDKGADVNVPGDDGWTALYSACCKGKPEIVRLLLNHGAKLDYPTEDGWTPLIAAVYENHLEVARILLEAGADPNHKDKDGSPALIHACEKGYLDIIKLLLEYKADVMVGGEYEETPLIKASVEGHFEVVKHLLGLGVAIDPRDCDGGTALTNAAENGHLEVMKVLVENGASLKDMKDGGYSSLHIASDQGHLDVVKWLVQKGVDITACGDDGWTSLHLACDTGHIEIVEYLLSIGASPDVSSKDDYLPLHCASEAGHDDIVKLLMDLVLDKSTSQGKMAPLDLMGNCNRTPLFLAAMGNRKDVVDILLPHSSLDLKDRYGTTPLSAVVRNGHEEIFQLLIPSKKDKSNFFDGGLGRNLLWWAKGTGQDSLVQTVLDFAKELGIEDPQPDEGEVECSKLVQNDDPDRYCSVCTRNIPDDTSYMKCETCEDFDICFQCLGLKVECVDSSHEWKLQEPDDSESDDEDTKKD